MAQSKYLTDAARLARARLDPQHPGFGASAEVRIALEQMQSYLDSWVYPLLDALERGSAPDWLKLAIAHDIRHLDRLPLRKVDAT